VSTAVAAETAIHNVRCDCGSQRVPGMTARHLRQCPAMIRLHSAAERLRLPRALLRVVFRSWTRTWRLELAVQLLGRNWTCGGTASGAARSRRHGTAARGYASPLVIAFL